MISLLLVAGVLFVAGCGDDSHSEDENSKKPAVKEKTESMHTTLAGEPVKEELPLSMAVKAVEPAPRPTGPLPEEVSCISSECHASFATANHIHGPVSEAGCFVCHEQDTGGHVYPLIREGNDVCVFCHTVTGKNKHVHQAVEDPGCLSCHQSHVSDKKFLLTRNSIEAVCRQCHEMERGDFVHAPFKDGECTNCHQPHESDAPNLLRGGEGSEHCFMCHKTTQFAMNNAPYVHEVAAQDCTICHNPHATGQPNHLRQPIDRLCLDCHADVGEFMQTAEIQHAGVFTADKCVNCHDPHASGYEQLFKSRIDQMCLACHNREIVMDSGKVIANMQQQVVGRKFLHGPIRYGECSACHNAHGSSYVSLLKEKFPKGFYENFDLQNYALCFTCHEQQLITQAKAPAVTDFRDGDVNLHFLHVNKQRKGRTCKACHAVHGSDLPKHMAEEVPFEGSPWIMPVGWERTEDGGRCSPGCHDIASYDRKSPVNENLLPSDGGDQ